jgi:pimeloyl-ACP methyl ester carboxylesterase
LADSPIALAAWMIDHDVASYAHIVKLFVDGEPYGDLTARRHPRQHHSLLGDEPEEVYQAPRSWTERSYHKLVHFNELPKGGHFAAWEQPKIFTEELRAGFRSLRTQQADKAA